MRNGILTLLLILGSLMPATLIAQSAKVQSAYNYMRSGEWELARAAIDQAIQDPKTQKQAKTWFYRGSIYSQFYIDTNLRKGVPNTLQEAISSFKQAMTLDPKNQWQLEIQQSLIDLAMLAYNGAVLPYNMRDYATAYEYFLLAADTYESLNTYFQLGLVDTFATLYGAKSAVYLQKYKEAEGLINRMRERNISRPEMFLILSDMALGKKDTAQAIQWADSGVMLFPNDKSLMIQQLNLYLFSGNAHAAIQKLKEAIQKEPDFSALYLQLGSMYERIGDSTNARLAFEASAQKDPNNFDALYRLGALYYNRAVDINNAMNKLDLGQQKLYDSWKKQRDANFSKSLPYLEQAYLLKPTDMDVLVALKELYARLGQMDKSNLMKQQIEQLKK